MKTCLLGAAAIAAVLAVQPAQARLQLSIGVGASTFTCFDGELSCDLSGANHNLLTVATSVGGAFVQVTLAQSAFGKPDELQLSSDNILNTTGAPITIKLLASDTSFIPPTTTIKESGSLTFNDALGSGASSLAFWADPLNTQGANPNNTPGALLFSVAGTPASNPDSFSGTHFSPFVTGSPFSMTEGASLSLIGGGSITGFNQSMQTISGVPEPGTWALMLSSFGLLGALGWHKSRKDRLAPAL